MHETRWLDSSPSYYFCQSLLTHVAGHCRWGADSHFRKKSGTPITIHGEVKLTHLIMPLSTFPASPGAWSTASFRRCLTQLTSSVVPLSFQLSSLIRRAEVLSIRDIFGMKLRDQALTNRLHMLSTRMGRNAREEYKYPDLIASYCKPSFIAKVSFLFGRIETIGSSRQP